MGLIVLSVAILPLLGVGGAQILKAETSGPLKESKLTPRIADTAQALYIIYFGISVALTVEASKFSESAKAAIEKAGGTVVVK